MNLKQLANRHRQSIRDLSGFLTVVLFFATAIGSYRFFLVFGILFLLKALKLEKPVMFLFLPAFIVTFYIDVNNGPMLQPSSKSRFLLILPIFFVVGSLVTGAAKRLIINLTEGRFFTTCPSCRFHNIHLVEKCSECTYEKGIMSSLMPPKISPSFCGDKIQPRLLNLLRTNTSEAILFHKKLTSFVRNIRNGVRQARKHLIVSTSNLIILDYYSFHFRMPDSWREKDVIPLADIISVEVTKERFFNALRPVLRIKTTNNDVYEIVLSTYGKYVAEINKIATIIKSVNPQVETNLSSIIGDEYNEKDERILLLMPFIILLLVIALWRLFQYVQIHGFNEVKF